MKTGKDSSGRQGRVLEVRSAAIWIQVRLGVQVALRAKPEDVENCKPKTELGKVVRGLVMEAAKGRATAMKNLMRFLDYVEDEEIEASQRLLPGVEWDWSPDGVWLTKAEPSGEAHATHAAPQSSRAAKDEAPLSRQQRRYLARLQEKEEARAGQIPKAA
jgi:hypothetical protein